MSFTCKNCSKSFRKETIRDKHEYDQICYPDHLKTYCKICDIHTDNVGQYKDHLISRVHLNNIGNMDVVNINILNENHDSKLKIVTTLDPVLAQCKTNCDDEEVKVFFKDGSVAKINVDDTNIRDLSMTKTDNLIKATEIANTPGLTYKALVERERGIATPTPRQEKILAYLAKFQGTGTMEMAGKFKLILEKINNDDADFLATHIRNCANLTIESKQIYCAYLDEFIKQLTWLVINGQTTYRGMDLFGFVARLTK